MPERPRPRKQQLRNRLVEINADLSAARAAGVDAEIHRLEALQLTAQTSLALIEAVDDSVRASSRRLGRARKTHDR